MKENKFELSEGVVVNLPVTITDIRFDQSTKKWMYEAKWEKSSLTIDGRFIARMGILPSITEVPEELISKLNPSQP